MARLGVYLSRPVWHTSDRDHLVISPSHKNGDLEQRCVEDASKDSYSISYKRAKGVCMLQRSLSEPRYMIVVLHPIMGCLFRLS